MDVKKYEKFIYNNSPFILGKKMEISKEDIRYDGETNRIIITTDDGEITLTPQIIREILPTMSEEEKVRDLSMMIHDINREKFTRMKFFIAKMVELRKGIDDAREELKNCMKMTCVKKWQAIIKSYVDEKNTLAEIRRTIGILEKQKPAIRARIAKLGHDPIEETGEEK